MLRPGFSADSAHFSGKSFNFSAFLSVGRKVSPDLSWNLGVESASGARTRFCLWSACAELCAGLTLAVGFPRTGLTIKFRKHSG